MVKKTEEIKTCITQQKTFIHLNLETDFLLEVMFNLEEDKITFPVLKVPEEATHLLKIHSAEFSKHR
jgi:hypothetical protein